MKYSMRSILTVMLSGAIACTSVFAVGEPHDVIAIVNGKEITTAQVNDIDLALLTPQQKKQLIDSLIIRQLLLEQALEEGFDKQDHVAAAVLSSTETQIVTLYLVEIAASFEVSDEALRSLYDDEYSGSSTQYKISHILLTSEDEGQALIASLVRGDDFVELAKQNSQDMVSAQKGGDLGWLVAEDIMPALYSSISGLGKGEISRRPIQTPFGWHILRLEDMRIVTPPKFEDVRQSIWQQLIEKSVIEYMDKLKSEATIEIK